VKKHAIIHLENLYRLQKRNPVYAPIVRGNFVTIEQKLDAHDQSPVRQTKVIIRFPLAWTSVTPRRFSVTSSLAVFSACWRNRRWRIGNLDAHGGMRRNQILSGVGCAVVEWSFVVSDAKLALERLVQLRSSSWVKSRQHWMLRQRFDVVRFLVVTHRIVTNLDTRTLPLSRYYYYYYYYYKMYKVHKFKQARVRGALVPIRLIPSNWPKESVN